MPRFLWLSSGKDSPCLPTLPHRDCMGPTLALSDVYHCNSNGLCQLVEVSSRNHFASKDNFSPKGIPVLLQVYSFYTTSVPGWEDEFCIPLSVFHLHLPSNPALWTCACVLVRVMKDRRATQQLLAQNRRQYASHHHRSLDFIALVLSARGH